MKYFKYDTNIYGFYILKKKLLCLVITADYAAQSKLSAAHSGLI